MKIIFTLLISLILVLNIHAQNACPVNIDSLVFKEVVRNTDQWNEKIVAFQGIVTEVNTENVKNTFYKVALGNDYVWIGGPVEHKDVKVGQLQRVLGILCKGAAIGLNKKYNNKSFFILFLASIDMNTDKSSVFWGAQAKFDEWMNGKLPVFGK